MSKTFWWLTGIVALIVVLFIYKRWDNSRDAGVIKVAVERSGKRTIIETVNATGKIYPENEVKITPEFSGQVTELKISEGEYVKKGQLLARIGNRSSITAPMDGIISSLKVKKGESVAGNTFNIGTEIMTVADMSVLELRVDVSENDIVKVQVGDSADIEVDAYSNRNFRGIVSQISNSTRSSVPGMPSNDATEYQVRIRIDSASYKDLIDTSDNKVRMPFRPGMNASASIRTKISSGILAVPITSVNARVRDSDLSIEDQKNQSAVTTGNEDASSSIRRNELEEVVFVVGEDNTVRKAVVQTGIQDMNYIEIKTGLIEGDSVVIAPFAAVSKELKSGMKVKVVEKARLFDN